MRSMLDRMPTALAMVAVCGLAFLACGCSSTGASPAKRVFGIPYDEAWFATVHIHSNVDQPWVEPSKPVFDEQGNVDLKRVTLSMRLSVDEAAELAEILERSYTFDTPN